MRKIIRRLDADQLRLLRETYADLIARIDDQIAVVDRRSEIKKTNAARLAQLQTIADQVADQVAAGYEIDVAMSIVARRIDAPIETITFHWRQRAHQARAWRAVTAARLARAGRSDAEIAAALDVSPRTVQRDLRARRDVKFGKN